MKKTTKTYRDFYCTKCSNKGIPLARTVGHLHGSMHLKKLYCCTCRQEVNHVEIANQAELEQFKINFENGVYNEKE